MNSYIYGEYDNPTVIIDTITSELESVELDLLKTNEEYTGQVEKLKKYKNESISYVIAFNQKNRAHIITRKDIDTKTMSSIHKNNKKNEFLNEIYNKKKEYSNKGYSKKEALEKSVNSIKTKENHYVVTMICFVIGAIEVLDTI